MTNIDKDLFSSRESQIQAFGDCPSCGGQLRLKHKGKSTFLGCSNYPECVHTESLQKKEVSELKIIEDSECPKCSAMLAVKQGRFGMFIGCTDFPTCVYVANLQLEPIERDLQALLCPECKSGDIVKKQSRSGKFFYACNGYPQCKYTLHKPPVAARCPSCNYTLAIRQSESERLVCANKNCAKPFND